MEREKWVERLGTAEKMPEKEGKLLKEYDKKVFEKVDAELKKMEVDNMICWFGCVKREDVVK